MNMNSLQLKLCDIQGRLFELSEKYSSKDFIRTFMRSEVAANLDSSYNRMQWMGEEYLLEELTDEVSIDTEGEKYGKEILYWIGYIYRYWAQLTGESSKNIYRQAPAETMKRNYLMFHTHDPEIAIEDLKEIYHQRKGSKQNYEER